MEPLSVLPIRMRVTAVLRKSILSGDYAPGQELSLTQVADELGISRTPVREAFQTLEHEGLLTLRMNKGAVVNNINEKFIRDHFEVRILLECKAVTLAIQRCRDFDDMEKLQADAEAGGTRDEDAYNTYNQQFHVAIWQKADNARLFGLLTSSWNGPSISRSDLVHDHERLSIREHRFILSSMQQGDEKQACAAMKAHLERSMNNVLRDFQQRKA